MSGGPAHAEDASSSVCGEGSVTPAPKRSRQINLVLDDSGSMFAENSKPLDRWSQAKYSLEVFAAMLEPGDSLNVYRMSDFKDGKSPNAGAQTQLSGDEPVNSRVSKIHSMTLQGGGTPYAPVQDAYDDLVGSTAQDKWLVIVSDGEFNDRETAAVKADLRKFIANNTTESTTMRVAFLAIGPAAPRLDNDPDGGIYFEQAPRSSDLLNRMTRFANLIFERNEIVQSAPGRISPDVDLEVATVFAQGANVTIGNAQTSRGEVAPASIVEVEWTTNPTAEYEDRQVPAVPDKNLHGMLATFENLPKGDITFDVTGAQTINVFFKPKVAFGVKLTDEHGNIVDADKIVGGQYTLNFGFMDALCNFIESDLLGEIEYTARQSHDGQVVVENFRSGDKITMERGEVQLDVSAVFLGGATSSAQINLRVLQPAPPAVLAATPGVFDVSRLGTYGQDQAMVLQYAFERGGTVSDPTPEEWATLTPESFTVAGGNLGFDVIVSDEIGTIYLLPLPPDGNVYAADTGNMPVSIEIAHVFDEQLIEARVQTSMTINDDLSLWDRFVHWFQTEGWKILLAALLLLLLLGYVFKRRFSKKIKKRPRITGTPRTVGLAAEAANGKFRISGGKRYLPFVADTATLTYVPPGVTGFRALKLKAGPRKTMIVTNWRDLAKKRNVELNGTLLDEETKRAPILRPASAVVARTPQMTYDVTPNA